MKLDPLENYIVNLEFIPDITIELEDHPRLFISEPILINKYSDPDLINKFIFERLDLMVDCFYLDDDIIKNNVDNVGPVVIAIYTPFLYFIVKFISYTFK